MVCFSECSLCCQGLKQGKITFKCLEGVSPRIKVGTSDIIQEKISGLPVENSHFFTLRRYTLPLVAMVTIFNRIMIHLLFYCYHQISQSGTYGLKKSLSLSALVNRSCHAPFYWKMSEFIISDHILDQIAGLWSENLTFLNDSQIFWFRDNNRHLWGRRNIFNCCLQNINAT